MSTESMVLAAAAAVLEAAQAAADAAGCTTETTQLGLATEGSDESAELVETPSQCADLLAAVKAAQADYDKAVMAANDGLPPDEDAATTTMPTIIGGAVAGFAVLAALIWFAIHMQKGKQDAHPQDEEGRPNVDAANRAHFDNPTFTRGGNLERASAAQQDVGAAEIVYVEADPNQPAEYNEAKRLAAVYAEVQDPPTVVYAEVIDPNVTYTPLADGKATYAAANSGHAANSEA